jgi:hypothetical protein
MRNTPLRRRRPALETLEERGLLSTVGLPWPDPGHLTLSFAPDGTLVDGAPSALYQTLGAGPQAAATWQTTVLEAFQSWAVLANINIGLVVDNGAPAGQPGPPEGKIGQGDIRISARPLSASTLAQTVPFDLFGTWTGNVILNSTDQFGNGSNGTNDLFTAALHEAGHIFGLPDSTDPTSAMYESDVAGRTGPSAADIAALQAIYGARTPDAFEGVKGNDTFGSATNLAFLATANNLNSSSGGPVSVADISTPTDRDTYKIVSTIGAPFVVTVHASGLSLLTPRLTVFDALGQPVATAVTTDPLHNDLTVTVPSAHAGATFYARVESGQPGVFGIGSYRIAAGKADLVRTATTVPAPFANTGSSGNGQNDTLAKATLLRSSAVPDNSQWAALTSATIVSPTRDNYYRFKTDNATDPYLLASVWGTQPGGLTPRIDVLDQSGNPVPFQILYHDADTDTVQVSNVLPNTWYVIRVSPLDSSTHATGRFVLGLDQHSTAVPLATIASGTLQAGQNQDVYSLNVTSGRLFHFDLSGTGGVAGTVAVKVVIYDSQNRPVYTLLAVSGSASATGNALLGTGKYTVRVIAATRSGAALPRFFYNLRGLVRSHPIGPSPINTTLAPVGTTPTSPVQDPYTVSQSDPLFTVLQIYPVYSFSNPWVY